MKYFFRGILIWGIVMKTCLGCPIIEDKSTDDSFGCILHLNLPTIVKDLMQRRISESEWIPYSVDDFIAYKEDHLTQASYFLLKAESFSFSDVIRFKKFLENLKEVVTFYENEYEKAYNEFLAEGICCIGRSGDIRAYILSINEYLNFLDE